MAFCASWGRSHQSPAHPHLGPLAVCDQSLCEWHQELASVFHTLSPAFHCTACLIFLVTQNAWGHVGPVGTNPGVMPIPNTLTKESDFCSGWCGSVGWVLACELKGHQFNSQLGHMPGMQVSSPTGGVWEATNQFSLTYWCISPFLSPSFPLSLKINK